MNPASLIGVDLFGYAKAWQEEHAKARIIDDLTRLWQGMPTRHQVRAAREAAKARVALQAAQERAARNLGLA